MICAFSCFLLVYFYLTVRKLFMRKGAAMKNTINALIKRYIQDKVAQTSATLAYYTLFAFFPFLLFFLPVSSPALDFLGVSGSFIFENLSSIVPSEVLMIAQHHMQAPVFSNTVAIIAWILIAIYFFVRSINVFLFAIERAYSLGGEKHTVRRFFLSFLLSLGNMFLLFMLVALIVLGKNVLGIFSSILPMSESALCIWHYGRFILLALIIFGILLILYGTAAVGQDMTRRQLLPGALAAALGWLVISMCFSYYVSHMGRYSILYGSLGAVIVLLLWLYLSSLIIVMGAELNGILRRRSAGCDEE